MHFYLSKNTSNFLKVISAVTVMLHHYSQYVCVNGISESFFFKALSAQGGFIGVAIFFFLSGYGLMESESKSHIDALGFFKRRFLKIYLPVLLVTIIWMLVCPFFIEKSPFGGNPIFQIEIGNRVLDIHNILWRFGDGVLWFVKVLIPLYGLFYIFSIIYQRNKTVGAIYIWLATILLTIYVAIEMAPYASISILYFTLGVHISIFSIRNSRDFIPVIGILSLMIVSSLCFLDLALAIHSVLNVFLMGMIILLLSMKEFDFKVPSIIALLSFDIYLTHHKVLMCMKDSSEYVGLWAFCGLTIVMTIVFFLIRTKLFKI